MILSDRDLRKLLASGGLVIEPFDEGSVQPSSIDLRVGHQFRVFANSRYPYIDVRRPMEGLTELVEASGEEPFILHPGEFVLGSTLENVTLPDDVVGRLEGKSSMGRLGLLIHSSLPASESVLFQENGSLRPRPIGDLVRKRVEGQVVSFDPGTFVVGFHEVTGWYEGPPDRIFEVVLASGRRVRVTGGHNLFTLNPAGELTKVRTHELVPGTRVAVPRRVPDPRDAVAPLDLLELVPGSRSRDLVRVGPAVDLPPVAEPADHGDLGWDAVVDVRDTGETEPIYDLEVRPGGRHVENFLAGGGGVFVANTAGFVDAGWSGHLTLELSNVANLPITIYPGMKIGQLCLFQMTSPAEYPYGSPELRSKYQGQKGPTPSRYFENFDDEHSGD